MTSLTVVEGDGGVVRWLEFGFLGNEGGNGFFTEIFAGILGVWGLSGVRSLPAI